MYDYGNDSDDDEFNYDIKPNVNKQNTQAPKEVNYDIYDAEPIEQSNKYQAQNFNQQNDNDLQIEDDWDFNDNDKDKQQMMGKIMF